MQKVEIFDPTSRSQLVDFDAIESKVKAFEKSEMEKRGITQEHKQWQDPNPQSFTKSQRAHTTILFGGLTLMHDSFIEAAFQYLGYHTKSLDCPDVDSLQLGKEFGNRGQCNPTYFTVGNLVKYLIHLRDEQGISTQDIIDKYLFCTAGACGPCRFGMYVTEYRKALRDAGFDGFRVLLFQQNKGGINQAVEEAGLAFTPKFFYTLIKGILVGDLVNLMGYRMRPYEVVPGSVDEALAECKVLLRDALRNGKNIIRTLRKCRTKLNAVEIDRLQAKPKVSIIGEFWAMTTEGDGNYGLQRFLESEGAECDIQPVTNWILYLIWVATYDIKQSLLLKREDPTTLTETNGQSTKSLLMLKAANGIFRKWFQLYAKAIGLSGYKLPDMEEIADISHEFYSNELRGGEGHMEVGKLIQTFEHNKAHLVISVKPFGCMPSSGVSDGVQSLVTNKYPSANFLPIETSGDGAVNVYSRVQMALFKARKSAQEEYDLAIQQKGYAENRRKLKIKQKQQAVYYPKHVVAGTAANVVYDC